MARTGQLVILSTWFPPHVMGGAEVNAQLLAQFAAEHDWQVTVITGASVVPKDTDYSITIQPALAPRPSILYEPLWSRHRALELQHLIPNGAIVHSFDVLARSAAAELKPLRPDLTLIATLQDISPICGSIDGILDDGSICTGDTKDTIMRHQKIQQYGLIGRCLRYYRYNAAVVSGYRRQVVAAHDRVTTVSTFLRDYLALDDAQVIPDLLIPPTLACRVERTDAPTIVAVGRLGQDKGTDLLIDALTVLSEYLLKLVGSGDINHWREYARGKDVLERIEFVGRVPLDDVGCWYHAADVSVLASRAPEASSRTVLEAMSCGRPVVGPDFAGPAELIIEGSTGRKFQRNDPNSLAAAIKQAFAERTSLGRRAAQYAKRFLPETIGPRYLKVYDSSKK